MVRKFFVEDIKLVFMSNVNVVVVRRVFVFFLVLFGGCLKKMSFVCSEDLKIEVKVIKIFIKVSLLNFRRGLMNLELVKCFSEFEVVIGVSLSISFNVVSGLVENVEESMNILKVEVFLEDSKVLEY